MAQNEPRLARFFIEGGTPEMGEVGKLLDLEGRSSRGQRTYARQYVTCAIKQRNRSGRAVVIETDQHSLDAIFGTVKLFYQTGHPQTIDDVSEGMGIHERRAMDEKGGLPTTIEAQKLRLIQRVTSHRYFNLSGWVATVAGLLFGVLVWYFSREVRELTFSGNRAGLRGFRNGAQASDPDVDHAELWLDRFQRKFPGKNNSRSAWQCQPGIA